MRTLVFGKTGQVAQSLAPFFPEAVFLGREQADFERPQTLTRVLNEHRPTLVLNAAAYTLVDRAEIEPGRAQLINAEAPGEIASWCKNEKASLIHYSTDYVYPGTGDLPWGENDPASPRNRYGATKLSGEQAVLESGCHAIILRTSWVYSAVGKNFVKTMFKLGQERESLSVVDDQIGSPTYAPDLAEATLKIIRHENFTKAHGVYNLSNSGFVSWHGFALQIFEGLRTAGVPLKVCEIKAGNNTDFPTPAKRPLNSRMNTLKFKHEFGFQLRPWQAALDECLIQILKS